MFSFVTWYTVPNFDIFERYEFLFSKLMQVLIVVMGLSSDSAVVIGVWYRVTCVKKKSIISMHCAENTLTLTCLCFVTCIIDFELSTESCFCSWKFFSLSSFWNHSTDTKARPISQTSHMTCIACGLNRNGKLLLPVQLCIFDRLRCRP